MELILNLVWVFVAIAGILLQIVTLSRTAGASHRAASPARKVVAMGCALVILFFVISMTDDLHDQLLVWEESKHPRISAGTKNVVNAPSSRIVALGFLASLSPVLFFPPAPGWSRLAAPRDFQFAPSFVRESFGGRAPPTSLI